MRLLTLSSRAKQTSGDKFSRVQNVSQIVISELKKQTNKTKQKQLKNFQSARVLETLSQYAEEEYLERMLLFGTGGSEAVRDISVQ